MVISRSRTEADVSAATRSASTSQRRSRIAPVCRSGRGANSRRPDARTTSGAGMSGYEGRVRSAAAADMRIVGEGLWFPEGPVMMPDGRVAVVEVGAGTIVALGPDGARNVIATPGGGPNGLAWGPDDALFVCNNGGLGWAPSSRGTMAPLGIALNDEPGRIERVDPTSGTVTRLYDECDGNRLNAPNDIVFAPDGTPSAGGFWFTDYGKTRGRVRDLGAVYWAAADGSKIVEAAFPIPGGPNGIGLSPDGARLYVPETGTGRIWQWEVAGPGQLVRQPGPDAHGGTLLAQLPGGRKLDSMGVTAAGNVVVGTLFPGELTTIDPNGWVLDVVGFQGEPMPTNVCFGGSDLMTAYVTLSLTGRVGAIPWPEPGLRLSFAPAYV